MVRSGSYRPGYLHPAVLSLLQYRLDSGSLPSTLKVYVAAIASFRASPTSALSPALGPRGGVKSSFTATIRAFNIR